MTKGYYTLLEDRIGVSVRGAEARGFLQALVTQDLIGGPTGISYAALLNAQGRLEHDFFVYPQDDGVLLECDAVRGERLAATLARYRLRREIVIDYAPLRVVAAWGDEVPAVFQNLWADPRPLPGVYRNIIFQPSDLNELNKKKKADFKFYHRLCIGRKIPCGGRDIAWGEDTAADIGLDRLNGVSYAKGCYLGQELTSRMHHRGLAKKGLYAVRIAGEALPAFTDIVTPEGDLIGEMRSHEGDLGLAVLRHDQLSAAARMGIVPMTDGDS